MKAAQIYKNNQLSIINIDRPVPVNNEVLIKVKSSGICGTDLHIYKGDYKGTYPIIPGHEFSGVIQSIGPDVKSLKPGDRIAIEPNLACGHCYECLNNRQHFCENTEAVGVTLSGGMAQYVKAPEEAVFPIGNLSFDEASFMEPLSCVLHGIDKLNPRMASNVLLIGSGPIGLLLLQCLNISKCSRIDMVDKDSERLKLAKKLGAHTVFTDINTIPKDSYDIVCEATGVTFLLEQSIKYVKPSGKVLWFGVPNVKAEVKLKPFEMFAKEISIITSYTSCRNSWQAIRFMQNNKLDLQSLISHKLSLEDFEKGLKILETHSEPVMKILITPNS